MKSPTLKKNRKSIPPPLAAEILYMSNRTCCVCTEPGKPVQIHHIDEEPSNNSVANLAVLCLHCHEETQKTGGFGRKLDSAQVFKFREEWLIRVNRRRSKADEDSIKAVLEKDTGIQKAIPLRDYVPMLPELLKHAYSNARDGWAGTSADMLNASYYVADVLEGMLVYLASFYPDGHFDGRDARDYISEVVSVRYSWHRHHLEPKGAGPGGTVIAPMVAMNVISDLRSMVDDMVSSLAGDPRNYSKFNFLEWRAKWESAAGEAIESAVHLTVEGQTLLKKAAIGENGSILKTTGIHGITITTDRFEIRTNDPPRIKAKYLKAFNDLITLQLVTACDSDKNLFQITDLGYKIADSITIEEDEETEIVKPSKPDKRRRRSNQSFVAISKTRLICCSFMPDDSSVIVGDFSGGFHKFELSSGTISSISCGDSSLRCVVVLPSTELVLAGDDLGRVLLIDMTSKIFTELNRCDSPVYSICINENQTVIYTAERSGVVTEWEFGLAPRSLIRLRPIHRHSATCFCVQIYNSAQKCFSVGADGCLLSSEVNGEIFQKFNVTENALFAVTSHDGDILMGDSAGTLKTGKLGQEVFKDYQGHGDAIRALAVSKHGKWCCTASKDKTLRVWELRTGRTWIIARSEDYFYDVNFSHSNMRLVACDGGGNIHFFDLPNPIDSLNIADMDKLIKKQQHDK